VDLSLEADLVNLRLLGLIEALDIDRDGRQKKGRKTCRVPAKGVSTSTPFRGNRSASSLKKNRCTTLRSRPEEKSIHGLRKKASCSRHAGSGKIQAQALGAEKMAGVLHRPEPPVQEEDRWSEG